MVFRECKQFFLIGRTQAVQRLCGGLIQAVAQLYAFLLNNPITSRPPFVQADARVHHGHQNIANQQAKNADRGIDEYKRLHHSVVLPLDNVYQQAAHSRHRIQALHIDRAHQRNKKRRGQILYERYECVTEHVSAHDFFEETPLARASMT